MNSNERTERYAKWQSLIEAQEKSGLSRIEFCKHHQIIVSQFAYYYSVLKRNTKKHVDISTADSLVPIKIRENQTAFSSTDIRIILQNGICCIFPLAADASCIKRFLEVIRLC